MDTVVIEQAQDAETLGAHIQFMLELGSGAPARYGYLELETAPLKEARQAHVQVYKSSDPTCMVSEPVQRPHDGGLKKLLLKIAAHRALQRFKSNDFTSAVGISAPA